MSEEKLPIEDQICWCLDHSTYEKVARQFKMSIAQINKALQKYNAKQTDEVFRHCDHEFEYHVILHENGTEYYAFCQKCKLNASGNGEYLIKSYPNALIVKKIIKDCDKKVCQFCQ